MKSNIRKLIADRLTHLMRVNPQLDTLDKIVALSGVSYGVVQRLKSGSGSDPSVTNVDDVASCFGLTLSELVSEVGGNGIDVTSEELTLIQQFRKLDDKDRGEVLFLATMKVAASEGKLKGLLSD